MMHQFIKSISISTVVFSLLLISCNNHKENSPKREKEEVTFFPVSSYLGGQILEIKEKGLSPEKIITINGKSDSSFLKLSELDSVMHDFTHPFIDSATVSKYYSSKKFFDQTLNYITLTYEANQNLPKEIPWLNWNVYINPETEKVETIYLVKKTNQNQITQLTWKSSKKYCKILTLNSNDSNAEKPIEITIKWEY